MFQDIAVHEAGFCQFTSLQDYMPEKAQVTHALSPCRQYWDIRKS